MGHYDSYKSNESNVKYIVNLDDFFDSENLFQTVENNFKYTDKETLQVLHTL